MQSADVREWVKHAALPPAFPREFEGNFLSAPVFGTDLLILLDDRAGTMAFCALVAPLDDSMPRTAWDTVLNYPAEQLPAGLMFGADDRSLFLYGRYYLARLTDATLERLFNDVFKSLERVCGQIDELLRDDEARYGAGGVPDAPVPRSEGASPQAADTESLSDEELLGMLLQSSMRV